MPEQYVLGIDAGTSSSKVGLVRADGSIQRLVSCGYPMSSPQPGWAEQNVEDWWTAACQAIREVTEGIDPHSVRAIGLSNPGASMALVDRHGQPVRPALLWMDARATELAGQLLAETGPGFWQSRIGYSAISYMIGVKLAWLRQHEPQAFQRAALVLQPADYVIYRLTGKAATDRSNACATGMYNLRTRQWDPEILAVLGVSSGILPRLLDSGAVAGHLTSEAAAQTGMAAGLPVVLGAWDQVCAVVGSGSTCGGDALLSGGTAFVLMQPCEQMQIDPSRRIWTVEHARAGQSVTMISMSNGGAVVEWYRRVFAGVDAAQEEAADKSQGLSGLPEGVEDVPPGSRGILVLPHLIGAAGIHMQPEYSGCVLGLRHGTGRAEIFHAILEAIAYEVRWTLEVLAGLGVQTPGLRLVGGATRSPIWPQIIADVTGLTVSIPHQTECAVLGAARLAQEAVEIVTRDTPIAQTIARRCVPNEKVEAVYDHYYELYQFTHKTLQEPLARLTHASRQ